MTSAPDSAVPSALPKPRAARRNYDWERAARLLASGMTTEEVCAAIGCDAKRLWRQIEKSNRFYGWLEREVQRRHMLRAIHGGVVMTPDDLSSQEAADSSG